MPRLVDTICSPKPRDELLDYLADFSSVEDWAKAGLERELGAGAGR